MDDRLTYPVVPAARWSNRIALFCACLLLLAIGLHRFSLLTTPVALNVFAATLAGAAVAIVLGGYAAIRIWGRGEAGALRAAIGTLVAVAMLAWPAVYLSLNSRLPQISDVTTDTTSPPRFMALAKRAPGMNGAEYPGGKVAEAQLKGYPDLHTFVVDRPVEEAFELVEEAVRKLRWKVTASTAPVARPVKAGLLEATDQTMIIGFWDDVVVRVEGSVHRARVDIRSASRYGGFDFGQNANRIRRFMVELQARVDASAPNAIAGRRSLRTTRSGAVLKKGKASDPAKTTPPGAQDRAPPSAPRARVQKETQR